MSSPDEQEQPRRRNPIAILLRSLLHGPVRLVALVFLTVRNALRPKAVRYGLAALLVLVLLGMYALSGNKSTQASQAQPGAQTSVQATQLLPAPSVVESYLKAQANYDAKGMWAALSDDMKASMQDSNATAKDLQTQLDAAKQQGRRYRGATYVGGVPTRDGSNVYFYVLSVDGPSGTVDVPYIYVLGRDGKIVSIQ